MEAVGVEDAVSPTSDVSDHTDGDDTPDAIDDRLGVYISCTGLKVQYFLGEKTKDTVSDESMPKI